MTGNKLALVAGNNLLQKYMDMILFVEHTIR